MSFVFCLWLGRRPLKSPSHDARAANNTRAGKWVERSGGNGVSYEFGGQEFEPVGNKTANTYVVEIRI